MRYAPSFDGTRVNGMTINLSNGQDDYIVDFVTEGAGFYVNITTDSGVRLDPSDLKELASWVAETCHWLDQQDEPSLPTAAT